MIGLQLSLVLAFQGGSDVDFEKAVLPLLRDRCWECHQEKRRDEDGRLRRPKGQLRLDHREGIRTGGGEGAAVRTGEPEKSPLYQRVTLPDEHDDRMPPEGDPLTEKQQDLLRRWIDEGADFGVWDSDAGETPVSTTVPERIRWLRQVGDGAPPIDEQRLDALRKAGIRVQPAVPGLALVEVAFPSIERQLTPELFESLSPLHANIVGLDLGRCAHAEELLPQVAGMPRLLRLDLSGTEVSSSQLKVLREHENLRVLNLHGTRVDDGALAVLATLPRLRRVYLWDTAVTAGATLRFAKLKPEVMVQSEIVLPEPGPVEPGRRRK